MIVWPSMDQVLDSGPGTYALLIELESHAELRVGSLGRIPFDSPFYIYFGSALGPGGLKARINHHLRPTRRAHWHIDYLRRAGRVAAVWTCPERKRLECAWATAARKLRGASPVPGFGASDCRCGSHLIAVDESPSLSAFTRSLDQSGPGRAMIRRWPVDGTVTA
jgi:Uri superfamily endonuclease